MRTIARPRPRSVSGCFVGVRPRSLRGRGYRVGTVDLLTVALLALHCRCAEAKAGEVLSKRLHDVDGELVVLRLELVETVRRLLLGRFQRLGMLADALLAGDDRLD